MGVYVAVLVCVTVLSLVLIYAALCSCSCTGHTICSRSLPNVMNMCQCGFSR